MIVGRQGSELAKMRKESQCTINVSRDPGTGQHENTREVIIRGATYEACQAAEAMVRAREAARMNGGGFDGGGGGGADPSGKGPRPGDYVLQVSDHAAGRVIGKQGSTIKRLQEQFPGCFMRVHEGHASITLESGTQAEKDAAFYAILEVIGPDREFTVREGPDGKSGWHNPGDKGKGGGKDPYGGGYGKDSYGKDGYGKDSWGKDSYGKDSYGKGYGKDSWGKDSWGKDSWGKDSWGKDSYGKDSWGKDSWGKDSYGKDGYGKDSWGKDSR